MSKNDFENKIKTSSSRKKTFFSPNNKNEIEDHELNLPISEPPPYTAVYEPTINVGDLVSRSEDIYKGIENCGIVIGSHWYRLQKSVRFSKRRGEWIKKYECVPRATIMWSDGKVSNIYMNLLTKKDVE